MAHSCCHSCGAVATVWEVVGGEVIWCGSRPRMLIGEQGLIHIPVKYVRVIAFGSGQDWFHAPVAFVPRSCVEHI